MTVKKDKSVNPYSVEAWAIEARRVENLARAVELQPTKGANKRAQKIRACRHLEIATDESENIWRWSDDDAPVLMTKTECGHRLCPKCQRRDAAKRAAEVSETLATVGDGAATVFLTLTKRARSDESLATAMRRVKRALERLRRCAAWNTATRGAFVKIEITRNDTKEWWHVHAHMLVTLHRDESGRVIYLKTKSDDGSETLCDLWRAALKSDDDEEGFVSIERIKANGVAEISKYIAKPTALDASVENIAELVAALRGAHLVMRWGCWRKESDGEKTIRVCDDDKEQERNQTTDKTEIPDVDLMEGRTPRAEPAPKHLATTTTAQDDDAIGQKRYMYVAETGTAYQGALNSRDAPFIWSSRREIVEKARQILEVCFDKNKEAFLSRRDTAPRVHDMLALDCFPDADAIDWIDDKKEIFVGGITRRSLRQKPIFVSEKKSARVAMLARRAFHKKVMRVMTSRKRSK